MISGIVALFALASITLEVESDGSSFFEIPDSLWVAPGTVIAVVSGDTLEAVPGVSGARTGIFLSPVPRPGDTIVLTFEVLPLNVPTSVALEIGTAGMEFEEVSNRERSWESADGGLYVSGSKRIGFSVGEGGGLDQGTRISVEGTAAPGITVSGNVTDRELGPYSSELASQLDRIFFEVEGREWKTRLGDMEWRSGEGTGPMAWRREVSGIDAGAHVGGGFTVGAGYGTSADTRKRTVFLTQEGVQGPYRVTSGWEIAPGSERVWLDGELLCRGSTEDYEMEYSAGLLTFTPSRLIREGQRVEVTFFQRGDGFRKDLVNAAGSYVDGSLSVEVKGFSSGDDRNSPLGFVLTPEAMAALAAAGEDSSMAWVDGGEYVGDGNGDYTLDSLEHFVYRGPDQGDWSVVFGRPPDGNGDYVYDSQLGGYLWIGEGEGTHLPRQYVQIPSSYETGAAAASLDGEELDLHMEAALSRRTGNLFNPGETTREGTYLSGSGDMEFWEGGPGITVKGRFVSCGYRSPGRLEADSSLSSWSLPAGYNGNDNLLSVGLGGDRLMFRGGGRYLEEGGIVERYSLSTEPLLAGLCFSSRGYTLKRVGTTGLAVGGISGIGLSVIPEQGSLKPFAGFETSGETWADSVHGPVRTGFGGALLETPDMKGSLRLELRRDAREGGGAPGPMRVFRGKLEGSYTFMEYSLKGSLEHSLTGYDEGGRLQADAVRLSFTGISGDLWSETAYSASGTISHSLEVVYVYVGEGSGEYSYDPDSGEYYPDPGGGYVLVYRPGEEGRKVTSALLESTATLSGDGFGLNAAAGISSGGEERTASLLLYGAFNEENAGGYNLELSPWMSWEEGLLSRLDLDLSVSDRRTEYSGPGLLAEKEWSVKASPVLVPLKDLEIRMEAGTWRRRQTLYSHRDTRGTRLEVDPVLVGSGLRPGLALAWEGRKEKNSGLSAELFEISPHFSWTGSGWYSTSTVTAGYMPGEAEIPVWFFDGNRPGLSWRVSARVSKKLESGLDLGLFYNGRRPADEGWTQMAGLDGTVNF